MTTAVGEEEIRVVISKGHMTAEMMVPSGFARDTLTEQLCTSLLQQSGVEIVDSVLEAVRAMLASPPPPPGEEQRVLLSRATPPNHGDDGYVQWFLTEPGGQESTQETNPDQDGDTEVSHYDRSAYTVVKIGDVIGQVIEPTPGTDGRDVLGQNIAAKPGKPAILKTDESVTREDSGQLIAKVDGMLAQDHDSVSVRQQIEVPEYVDFSTGNIDFCGDVMVREGVRDCFVVQATGRVEVKGLIEAATIKCGGDLVARGGMAGRDRGFIQVGGNLVGKYLDNIQGEIRGDMEIQREAINCDLTVHGAIKSPRGTLIGGRVVVTGVAELVAVGSGGGVATELVLGSVPSLEPIAKRLEQLIEQLEAKRDAIETEQELMTKNTRMMSAADKERQTEMMFEHQTAVTKIAEGSAAYEALTLRIQEQRTVDVTIHRKLFHGVVVTVGNQSFKIRNEVRGPITISLDGRGDVVYRAGEAGGGLAKIAELKAASV